ncbi:MAG: ComEC/Rec2 family competence protein [Spirochaetia bacterium]|nr:ComEC/Rec2 family competence protein [Spirochaetia bacterium]
MKNIKQANYFFFVQSLIRYSILLSIIIIFYLSYNDKLILYKPILFLSFCFFISSLVNVLSTKYVYHLIIGVIFIFYLLSVNLNSNYVFNAGFDSSKISELEGYVVKDQSKTKSDSYYFVLNCNKGYLKDKSSISIKGQIPILFNKDFDLLVFTPIRAQVEYDKEINIYRAKDINVLDKNNNYNSILNKFIFKIRDNRIYLLKKIKAYIHCPLARMLLLGRCDQEGFVFKDYALNLGCAHLLALSGMHLSIITIFFTNLLLVVFSKKKANLFSIVLIFCFIYITGPIPSLIRSLIMYLLNKINIKSDLKSEIVLLICAIIQAVIFPYTFRSAGCLFSYGALCAIFFYSSIFKIKSKIFSSILTTVFAILVTYPLSLSLGGKWCILSIFLSPLVTIFVTSEMFLSLILLINSITIDLLFYIIHKIELSIIGAIFLLIINIIKEVNFYLHKIIRTIEKIITFIFSKGSYLNDKLPNILINTKGYLIFAFIVLTTVAVYLYATHSFKFRSYKQNELEFPL